MPGRTRTTRTSRKLTPVPDADESEQAPEPPRPMTVTDAAASGSRRDLLVAQRSRLAKAVDSDDTRPRELAQLSRQLSSIDEEIRKIDLVDGNDAVGRAANTPDEPWNASVI